MLLLKSRIEPQKIQQASEHQSSADKQDERQAYLGNHESIAKAPLASAGSRAPSTFMQTLPWFGSRGLQRRRKSKQNPRGDTD